MKAFRHTLIAVAVAALASTTSAEPSVPGLYATFHTSMGDFTARLDFEKVPMTVANFVGLAEGTRSWIDIAKGLPRTRSFYDGLIFHRVIDGFMIQGGSRNGLGTDGPGYVFADEFHAELQHDAAGILSMANSGPNSNGSQFFITLAPTSWLDDRHSVFGRIVEGMDVVQAIGAVPTNANDRPLTPVVIESVVIHRIGPEAAAFETTAPGLPVVLNANPSFHRTSGDDFLEVSPTLPFTEYFFGGSEDLGGWELLGTITDLRETYPDPINITGVSGGKSRYFFNVPKAVYPLQASSLTGKRLSFVVTSGGDQPLELNFTANERNNINFENPVGTYLLDGNTPGTIGAYITDPGLPTLFLIVALSDFGSFLSFNLCFQTPNSGTFTAQLGSGSNPAWPLFGTFTLDPLP